MDCEYEPHLPLWMVVANQGFRFDDDNRLSDAGPGFNHFFTRAGMMGEICL